MTMVEIGNGAVTVSDRPASRESLPLPGNLATPKNLAAPKIGLALGGGAARGWAHIGVLRALDEAGLSPSIVAGTSIGAVVGGCYLADKLAELETFARGLSLRRILRCLDFNFSGSGLLTGQRLRCKLDRHLQDISIEQLEKPFAAVATEIGSGQEVWLTSGNLSTAIHASFALPGIFKPVAVDGRWLMDGACINPVPVSVCRALGADYVIAVTLNSVQSRNNTSCHSEQNDDQRSRELLQRETVAPSLSNVMMEAFNVTQNTISQARLACDPPDMIIAPGVNDIGIFDFHRAEDAIAKGLRSAKRKLRRIRLPASGLGSLPQTV